MSAQTFVPRLRASARPLATLTTLSLVAIGVSASSGQVSAAPTPAIVVSGGGYTATGARAGVFRDVNANGVWDVGEPGVGGVTVTAFRVADDGTKASPADDTNAAPVTTTTAANGSYTINATGSPCRVEFELPSTLSFLRPGPVGPGSGSFVQFISASGALSAGVINPGEYTGTATPEIVTGRNNTGDSSATTNPSAATWDSIYRLPYDLSSATGLTQYDDIGSTWGLGYDPVSDTVFTSAMVKRHAGIGPAGADAIYAVGPSVPAAWATPFTAVDTDGGALPSNSARGLAANSAPTDDDAVYPLVGKISWGDIDVSEDARTLYAVNLLTKQLQPIDIETKAAGAPIAIPDPGCTNGVSRPWSVAAHDGLVYVGVVCDASTGTAADLAAFVYAYNPGATALAFPGGTVAPGAWSANLVEEATPGAAGLQLTYPKGCGAGSSGCSWNPWIDTYSDADFFREGFAALRPQPILSDIEVDDDGSLILAFLDRTGDQFGYANRRPLSTNQAASISAVSGGDILRASPPGGAGTWTLENGGVVAQGAPLGGGTLTGNTTNNQGPGGGEFYAGENALGGYHQEATLGGIANVPGLADYFMTFLDPFDADSSGVVRFPSRTPGTGGNSEARIELVDSSGLGTFAFGKGNGLGDLELITKLAPIEIGNRVWIDTDGDGIQDPSEPPLAGVTVSLYADADGNGAPDGAPIATVTTDAAGTYIFSSDTTRADEAGRNYGIAQMTPGAQLIVGVPTTATGPDGQVFLTPPDLAPTGDGRDDVRDSDAGRTSGLSSTITLGGPGSNDHTWDFGYAGLNLGNQVWFDTNNDGTKDAAELPVGGVTVELFLDANNDGQITGAETTPIATDTTDGDGLYLFDGLGDGATYVVGIAPSNFAAGGPLAGYHSSLTTANASGVPTETAAPDPDNDADNDDNGTKQPASAPFYGGGVLSAPVTLNQGAEPTGENPDNNDSVPEANSNLTVDFGFYTTAIGNTVWVDDGTGTATPNNGVQEPGEPGLAGIPVRLYAADGTEVPVGPDGILGTADDAPGGVITDGNGNYQFRGLPEGDYAVEIDIPARYVSTADAPGTATPLSADADDNGAGTGGGTVRSAVFTMDAGNPANGNVVTNDNGGTLNPRVDFGVVNNTVSVGNQVWFDTNNNGEIDGVEQPTAGVQVALFLDADGDGQITGAEATPIAVDTTDAQGLYLFTEYTDAAGNPLPTPQPLLAGNYVVGVAPANFVVGGPLDGYFSSGASRDATGAITEADFGADDGVDGDDNGNLTSTGPLAGWVLSDPVALAPYSEVEGEDPDNNDELVVPDSSSDLSIDFGFYTTSIGDTVWLDNGAGPGTPNDGVRSGAEPPVAGVTVNLLSADGSTVLATTTTDGNGNYLFDDLPEGTYIVQVVPPAGYRSSDDPATGGDPANGTNDDDNGIGTGTGPINSAPFAIDPGNAANGDVVDDTTGSTSNPRVDFGLFSPPVSIGNQVWRDVNNDGDVDAGEAPIAGVPMVLFFDANGDGQITGAEATPVAYDTTDAQGLYLFTEYTDPAGNPLPTPQPLPAGNYVVGVAPAALAVGGPLAGTYSSGTTRGAAETDFGADDQQDNDDNGNLNATGPLAGYVLSDVINVTEGTEPTTEAPDNNDDATIPDANSDLTVDFGFYSLALGDYMWFDTNGDGQQSPGEAPVVGATVRLLAPDGTVIATTTTNADGLYLFDNLPAGDYIVEFVPPPGLTFTGPNNGADGSDSDAAPVTGRAPVTLTAGDPNMVPSGDYPAQTVGASLVNPTIDAGLVPVVAVGDFTWLDGNQNGVQDAGEAPLPGVTVTLLDAAGNPALNAAGQPVPPVVTDANGRYLFDNLVPGDYQMQFTPPAGYTGTVTGNGTSATDSNPTPATGRTPVFTIAPGVAGDTVADGDPATVAQFVNPTIDAGFFQSGSVGDTVWQDTNRNGQLDFAEPGVPGVTVTLYDGAGNIIATTTTDAQGRYLFTGLPPGDYAVGFSGLPSGLAITGQDLGGDDTRDSDVNPATGRTAVFRLGPGENNPTLDMGLVQPNVQPPGGGVGGGVGGGGGQLPRTGSDTNVLLNVAAWFLIVGGVLCLLASVRVRRRAQVR
jgi:hypothetical protein